MARDDDMAAGSPMPELTDDQLIEAGAEDPTQIPPMPDDGREIQVTVSINGRRTSLAPVMPVTPLTVRPHRVENSLPAGLRVGWLDADATDGFHIDVTAGAGVGSKYLVMTITKDGKPFAEEVLDIAQVTQDWFESVIKQGPTPPQTDG